MDLYDDLDFALIDSIAAAEPGPEDAPEYKEVKQILMHSYHRILLLKISLPPHSSRAQLITECKAKESKISELSDKVSVCSHWEQVWSEKWPPSVSVNVLFLLWTP